MRPTRYLVARDAALEAGDDAAVIAAERGAELWHRPPEEWELERADRGGWWATFTIDGHGLAPGDWVEINGERYGGTQVDASDAAALARQINATPSLRVVSVNGKTITVAWSPLTTSITVASYDTNLWASGPPDRRHGNSSVPLFVRNASRRMDGRRR